MGPRPLAGDTTRTCRSAANSSTETRRRREPRVLRRTHTKDLGPGGDGEANAVWFIEAPKRTAFLGDLVFNGVHSYVADGHVLAWLANLFMVERLCRGMDLVFPGHGAAAAPGKLVQQQMEYLLAVASHVKELAQGRTELTQAEKKELETRMSKHLPDAGLTFLIGMNADPVARELNRVQDRS